MSRVPRVERLPVQLESLTSLPSMMGSRRMELRTSEPRPSTVSVDRKLHHTDFIIWMLMVAMDPTRTSRVRKVELSKR